jgi:hypothetical protein
MRHLVPAQSDAALSFKLEALLGATPCQSSDPARHNLLSAAATAVLYLVGCSL